MIVATVSAANLLDQAAARLAASTTPRLDAEVLLAHLLECDRSWLMANLGYAIPAAVAERFHDIIRRRTEGCPVAYLMGYREFYGHRFAVGPGALVPRPESEFLVDAALEHLTDGDLVVDIGTGSGCIGLSIAAERPDNPVLLSDISEGALTTARRNAEALSLPNITVKKADLLPDEGVFSSRQTIVVANLPYVSDAAYGVNPDLRHEPALALQGGPDGLDVIRRLFTQLKHRNFQPKALLLEIDPAQVAAVTELAWGEVMFLRDLSGKKRVAVLT